MISPGVSSSRTQRWSFQQIRSRGKELVDRRVALADGAAWSGTSYAAPPTRREGGARRHHDEAGEVRGQTARARDHCVRVLRPSATCPRLGSVIQSDTGRTPDAPAPPPQG